MFARWKMRNFKMLDWGLLHNRRQNRLKISEAVMAEKFDPYHEWLGIPASEQPPDHYRLLGSCQIYKQDT